MTRKNVSVNSGWKLVTLPWNDKKSVNELKDENVK